MTNRAFRHLLLTLICAALALGVFTAAVPAKADTTLTTTRLEQAETPEIMPASDVTLSARFIGPCAVTAETAGYTGTYDGAAHGITVTVTEPAEGATVRYGTAEGEYTLDASPKITHVNESPLTVWYQATAEGYLPVTGSVTVEISRAEAAIITLPAANHRIYDGTKKALLKSNGEAEGGTLQYVAGTESGEAPASGWSKTIPKAAEEGTYYV